MSFKKTKITVVISKRSDKIYIALGEWTSGKSPSSELGYAQVRILLPQPFKKVFGLYHRYSPLFLYFCRYFVIVVELYEPM